jgi:hypothetical protein
MRATYSRPPPTLLSERRAQQGSRPVERGRVALVMAVPLRGVGKGRSTTRAELDRPQRSPINRGLTGPGKVEARQILLVLDNARLSLGEFPQ